MVAAAAKEVGLVREHQGRQVARIGGERLAERPAGGGEVARRPGARGRQVQPLAWCRLRQPRLDRGEAARRLGRESRLQREQVDVRPQKMAHQQIRILGHRCVELADRVAREPEDVEQGRLEPLHRSHSTHGQGLATRIRCQHRFSPWRGCELCNAMHRLQATTR